MLYITRLQYVIACEVWFCFFVETCGCRSTWQGRSRQNMQKGKEKEKNSSNGWRRLKRAGYAKFWRELANPRKLVKVHSKIHFQTSKLHFRGCWVGFRPLFYFLFSAFFLVPHPARSGHFDTAHAAASRSQKIVDGWRSDVSMIIFGRAKKTPPSRSIASLNKRSYDSQHILMRFQCILIFPNYGISDCRGHNYTFQKRA